MKTTGPVPPRYARDQPCKGVFARSLSNLEPIVAEVEVFELTELSCVQKLYDKVECELATQVLLYPISLADLNLRLCNYHLQLPILRPLRSSIQKLSQIKVVGRQHSREVFRLFSIQSLRCFSS
jgi:hypothetical protein